MNQETQSNLLYEKMAAEQETYRSWLLEQPPEEILRHTYEYTVREDILMAMEELALPSQKADALLSSPSPLADVYQHFTNMETEYMDVIRSSIENRAADVLAERQAATLATPLYRQTSIYAREHGEFDQWKASHQANIACREAIETEIRKNFDGMHLADDVAKTVLDAFGPDRVTYVLAATIQEKDWDGRFSNRNKEWAAPVPPCNGDKHRSEYIIQTHPAILDGFVSLARKEMEAMRGAREQTEKKPSIKEQLSAKPVPGDPPTKPKDREAR